MAMASRSPAVLRARVRRGSSHTDFLETKFDGALSGKEAPGRRRERRGSASARAECFSPVIL